MKLYYPSTGNFIAVVGNLSFGSPARRIKRAFLKHTQLEAYSINAPRAIPGIDFSDHLNFWDEGINAVMITDTAFMRNGHYHMHSDTAATLSYDKMVMVVEGIYAYLTDDSSKEEKKGFS